MSTPYPQLGERAGWELNPSVGRGRTRERLIVALAGLAALLLAFAISLQIPTPTVSSVATVLALTVGAVCVVALVISPRYEVTLTILVLYLGLLDGPVKNESTSHHLASSARDVLLIAIVIGMLMRLGLKRERLSLPPLSGWVLAFVAFVLVEALNPYTGNVLKAIGGYRQELEWVPCFFFGYLILRSRRRFRQFFLLLGVIALANGVVGAYQSRLSANQVAGWGPGYSEFVKGGEGNGITPRLYKSEGVGHIRPPALGSDSGFGGGIGAIALPGLLALLVVGRTRRRWPVLLCCVGALLAIATAASRTSVIIGAIALVTFVVLSLFAGLRVSRPLVGLAATAVLGLVVGSVLVATVGSGVFTRQETLVSLTSAEEHGGGAKTRTLSEIPADLIHEPFGYGLGTAGSAAGFGGRYHPEFEGQRVTGGSAYSLLMKELGVPGLLLWVGLSANAIVLALGRFRRVHDVELRTYLVAITSSLITLTIGGLSGPTLAVTLGAFLWFAPGVISYWLAGPGWVEAKTAPAVAS